MEATLFARQAIFNKNMEIVAYELLYRSSQATPNSSAEMNTITDEEATSTVLLNAFSKGNFEKITCGKQAYINFNANLDILSLINSLPADKIVIEILEHSQISDVFLARLAELKKNNITIALDDFVLTPQSEQLLPYADIIKLNVNDKTEKEIQTTLNILSLFQGKFLAEKVETYEQLQYCQYVGFNLFQGYFLEKPQLVK